jgi:V8-like Glu-specific endopeptidase
MTNARPADQAVAPQPPSGAAATTATSGAPQGSAPSTGTLAVPSTATRTSSTGASVATATTGAGATVPTTTTATAVTAPPGPSTADPGSPWTQGGQVTRTTGRVFFSLGGSDYSCSGSAVDSPDASTVVTAAHCVQGDAGFATRWVFVPGYDRGSAPFGIFAATHLAVLSGFARGDIGQDVALVNVGPNAAGRLLTAAVGGQPLSFDPAAGGVRAFGYPQGAPYDGSRLIQCGGSTSNDPRPGNDLGMTCGMTGGSSGGPWLADLDPATGRGRVVSVTSFSYADSPGVLYGPRLGPEVRQLYTAVASDPAV